MTLNATASPAGNASVTLSTLPSQETTNQCADTSPVPEYSVPRFLPFTAPSRKGRSSKLPRTRTASHLETLAAWAMKAANLPMPTTEYRFHPVRKWRFDFCWPSQKVALEVEGGTYAAGRHTRGSGFEADCVKYCEAKVMGWTVLRVTKAHINDGSMVRWVKAALGIPL